MFSCLSLYNFIQSHFYLLVAFYAECNSLFQKVETDDFSGVFFGFGNFADGGKLRPQFLVYFVFECQAAHQPAALSRDFCRVEGKPLFFGHANGDWIKLPHER